MARLPSTNPINAGVLPVGWPVDYLGSRQIWCPSCEGRRDDPEQIGEVFRVICASGFGFEAPDAAAPDIKSSRTAGKLGRRGEIEQCKRCSMIYLDPTDGTAEWWGEEIGTVTWVSPETSPPGGPERLAVFPFSG